jgi:hypothetical protein
MKRKPESAPAPTFIQVASSAISAIAYDRRSRTLSVRFTSGEIYDYFDVPAYVHDDFLAADSKGTYFARNVRDQFRFRRRT